MEYCTVLFYTKYKCLLDYMCRWEIFSKINKRAGLNTSGGGTAGARGALAPQK